MLPLQARAIEIFFHREARAQEADATEAFRDDRACGGIGDVQQRQRRRGFHPGCDLVHGVGADHQEIGARALQAPGGIRQQLARVVPLAGMLESFDLLEIQAVEQDPRRMQSTEPFLHALVDQAVVGHGGFPAHAAEHSDGLHAGIVVAADIRGTVRTAGLPDPHQSTDPVVCRPSPAGCGPGWRMRCASSTAHRGITNHPRQT